MQTLIVFLIVLAVCCVIGRKLFKSFRSGGCGACSGCGKGDCTSSAKENRP